MRDAWLLLLLLLGGRRPGRPAAGAPPGRPAAGPPPPLTLAMLFRLPMDGYETVHLATRPAENLGGRPGRATGPWREVGVFSSEARARELAIKPDWFTTTGVQTFASREAMQAAP